ncbi:MAG: phosphate/phosphite/phosphonate ABC transporter substrate-binding protein [Verrucomicrobiota bacterium]
MKAVAQSLFSISLISGAIAFLVGCSAKNIETITQENGEVWPAKITMALTPSQDDPEGRVTRFTQLSDYIASQIGIEVELIPATNYGPVIEAMRADKIDIAQGGSFMYMIAYEKAGVEAIATRGSLDGTRNHYSTLIATSPETGITSMEDLVAGAENYTMGFVDAASTSGHLVPRGYFESRGLNPEEIFREVVFTQTHLNAVMAAVAAKVDASAINERTYSRFIRDGRIKPEELIVLWESENIPTSPVFVRKELPVGLKKAIQEAYINLHLRAPDLMEDFRYRAMRPEMIWVSATDDMWDDLRKIAYNIDTMTLLSGSN